MQSLVARSSLRRLRTQNPALAAWQARTLADQVPAGADRDSSAPHSADSHGKFDPKQLDTLVCPLSKSKLRWDEEKSELISDELNVAYPIINGIPQLTPEKARDMKSPMPGGSPGDVPPQPS